MYSSSDSDESPDELDLNISNDQYYKAQPKSKSKPISSDPDNSQATNNATTKSSSSNYDNHNLQIPRYGSSSITHSLAAYDLWRPLYPIERSDEKLRNYHRSKLRHYKTGPQATIHHSRSRPIPIKSLTKTICLKQKKLRAQIISAIEKGMSREQIIDKYLLIRETRDLTAKHGELFLFEYSEEYPPVLSEIGMASNIKTFIQSKPTNGLSNGSTTHQPQQSNINQNLNNNLNNGNNNETTKESTPATPNKQSTSNEKHKIGTDTIIPSNSNNNRQFYFDRLKPGSKLQVIENNLYRAPIYRHEMPSCDFLVIRTRNSFYIRSVMNIYTVGQTMPLIAIPQPTDNLISKFTSDLCNVYIHKSFMESKTNPPSLDIKNLVALFPGRRNLLVKRFHSQKCHYDRYTGKCYRGESKFGTLSLQELRKICTPESYCTSLAMLAARQRLRDLNYTDSMIRPKSFAEMETEVKAAPWNTSRAIIDCIRLGRYYLDFKNHLIDPTGPAREGFSCIPWSKSPTEDEQIKDQLQGRIGRSNNVISASPSQNGVTQSQPVQMKNPLTDKIRREKLERLAVYQREAQVISELQSKVLSNPEPLSSEDESDIEDDEQDEENLMNSSLTEQLRDFDKLVLEGRTQSELAFEKEEQERLNMIRELKQNRNILNQEKNSQESDPYHSKMFKNKVLRITRTYESDDGLIERVEIVREPKIIALYVKNMEASRSHLSQTLTSGYESTVDDRLNQTTATCYASNGRRSTELHSPVQLCRADGMVLTINKSVLDVRGMRYKRRRMRGDDSS